MSSAQNYSSSFILPEEPDKGLDAEELPSIKCLSTAKWFI